MNRYSTIAGTLISFILVIYGIGFKNIPIFIDIPSVWIVCGGTVGTTLMIYGFSGFGSLIKILNIAFMRQDVDRANELYELYKFATKARKSGLLSLEEEAKKIEDPFMQKGLQLVIDGTDTDTLRYVLDKEIEGTLERHAFGQDMLGFMAEAGPAFGMIGTLIGLVGMLQNLADSSKIGPMMAVALLTTLYGAVLANIVFIPLSKKLEEITKNEVVVKNALLEGLMSMQAGENPTVVEMKLKTYLSPVLKNLFDERKQGDGSWQK